MNNLVYSQTLQYSTIDVSGASYAGAGEEFSVNAQDGQIQDLTFNNDGSKMFVVGLVFLAVSEYTLTTNFDVSTAIYAGDAEQLSVFDRVSSPRDLAFNNDGTKLFVLGSIDDVIIEYDLTVSFDVSTAVYAGAAEEFFVGAQETLATGLAFSNDGTKLFVIGLTDDAIIEYDLTVPYDVSTAIYAGAGEEFFVGAEEDDPQGLAFSNDGSRMFVVGHDDEAVVEYHLSVNFDVSTAVYAGAAEEFFVGAQESTPRGLAFSNDGTRLFVIGNDDDAVVEYTLPGAEYTEVPANDGSITSLNPLIISLTGDTFNDVDNDDLLNVGSQVTLGNVPAGLSPVLSLSDNDTRLTVTFTGNATDHQPGDDVADITFAFDDSAFSNATAASVANSGQASPFSSNVSISFLENALLQYSAVIDVSGAGYAGAGEEFSVSAHELFANDMAFNTDGSKMFVVGTDDDAVVEYTLTTPFDVSTATYAGAAEEFSVGAEEGRPRGLAFNTDGSKLFIIGNTDDAVIEYHLSVNFDVSTATYTGVGEEFFVGNEESIPTGLAFNSDGSKLFIIGSGDAAVVEYNLSTNFDVSTATHAGDAEEFSVSDQESFPEALAFNHDGSQMFVIGINSNAVIGYNLSVNFDVSTATYAGAGAELSVSDQESLPRGLAFSNDASGMFVIGTSEATVVEYTLPGAQYTEVLANDGSVNNTNSLIISITGDTFNDADNDDLLNVGSQVTLGNVPAGLAPVLSLSDNDTRVTVTFTGNATDHQPADDVADITFSFDDSAFSSATAASVANSGETNPFSSNVPISFLANPSLQYGTGLFDVSGAIYAGAAEELPISAQETAPTGLVFSSDGSKMFVIGAMDAAVVEYNLSTSFDVSTATYAGAAEEFFVGAEESSPRGLAFSNDGSNMFVIGSSGDAVVEYHLSVNFDVSTATYAGAAEEFFVGAQESVPHELTFSSDGFKMFVIGNSGEAVIEYHLSVSFDVSTATYAGAAEEFFVGEEESSPRGLAFSNDGSKMFVVGNSGDAVVEYHLSVNFDVSTATYAGASEEFFVGTQESIPSGLAFNSDGSELFVIGDGNGAVVEYTLPGAEYTEVPANDGSINNTNPLLINLTGDTFNDADNDDLLNVGSQVTLGNVPAGLTPVLSLSDNDTRVTVTFTGNAMDHQPADDVADITFAFDDSAFSSATAASVTNSGETSPFSSNVPINFLENASLQYGASLFDISGAVYAGATEEFSVFAQESTPTGMAFNNDGSKMFVVGINDDAVVEYTLTTPFDVSTATYAGAAEEFSVGAEESGPRGLAFNNDGSKLFIIGNGDTGLAVVEYHLSTSFDVSTANYAGAAEEFFVGNEENIPTGLAFSNDGSKMFVVGNGDVAVVEYNLSTNFDVSTAAHAGDAEEFSVSDQESFPEALAFNHDGSQMFVTGLISDAVIAYHLSVNFDVSTATYAGASEEFFVGDEETSPRGLAFSSDGSGMFVIGSIGDAVVEYTLPDAQYTEALANDGSINNTNSLIISLTGDTFNDTDNDDLLNVGSQVTLGNIPAGLAPVLSLSDNDTRVTVTFSGNATDHQPADDVADITFAFDDSAFSSATAASVANSGQASPFSSNVPINFLENASLQYGTDIDVSGATYAGAAEELSISAQESFPEALAFNDDGSKMFVVGNDDVAVVEYHLCTNFDVSTAIYAGAAEEFSVNSQEAIPRGLAFNNDGSKMFVVGSSDDAVVEYSLSTNFDVSTATYAGAGEEFFVGDEERTPRGLAFSSDGSKMFVIGSDNDAVVEYHLSVSFDVSTATYAGAGEEFSVNAQESTPQGLAFNTDGSQMFVLGTNGDAVVEYRLSVNFDVSTATYAGSGEEFFVGDEETASRGLAFSNDGSRMFVIGNIGEAVVEYAIPGAQYTEVLANDGSINNTNSLIISLTGDTFNDPDNDDLLNVGSQVTLGNIPAGLAPVLSLSDNDTRVTVTFTGNATDHQPADDVADITFSFDDSAFSSATAASVTNSGEASPFSSNVPISFLANPSLQYGTGIDVSGATYAGASEEFFVGIQDTAPQGLTFNNDGSKMFVLGFNDSAVIEYHLSVNFDVSTANYAGAGEEFFVGNEVDFPLELVFNNDGSKMFVIGSSDVITEYNLSVNFDVSTATYAGAAEGFFVGAEDFVPTGMAFNNEGSRMFVIGVSDRAVVEYHLSVNFDVSTATYAGAAEEFSVSDQEISPQDIAFSDDGSKMFVIGSGGDAVVAYHLSVNFDVSTATYAGAAEEFFVGAQESIPTGLAFNSDGSKLFVVGTSDNAVVEYTLPGAQYTEVLANDGSVNNANSLTISLTGDTFNDTGNDDLLNVGSQVTLGNVPAGLTPVLSLSDNDTRVTVTFTGNATDHQPADDVADITFAFDDSAFSNATAASVANSGEASPFSSNASIHFDSNPVLRYGQSAIQLSTTIYAGAAEEFSVNAQEIGATGLTFNHNGLKLFVIGSGDDAIVEYNLTVPYDVSTATYAGATEEFSVNAQEILPQGLVFDQDGSKLFVIGIDGDAVVEYDLSTSFDVSTATYAGAAEEFFVGAQESVPTGLAFNHDGSRMYVVGQANDEVFQYNLSTNFDVSTAAYSNESLGIQLQESGPTGLVFNEDGTEMYLIGSAGDDVVQYQLTSPFDVTTASHTGTSQEFSVTTEEGIPQDLFFDPVGRTLLILGNTGGGAIAEYHLTPEPVYSEIPDNDGEVASSSPLVIQLIGDNFSDTDNDDLLNVGSQVTLGNVPAGLSPVLSLSDNDTRVTVTFTGNATDHQPADDVADITFAFDDSAFSSATATSVTNSGEASPFSSNASIHFDNNPVLRYGQSAIQLSTTTYAGAAEEFSVNAQEIGATGLTFNHSGLKLFVLGSGDDAIVEYNLMAPYDVSTATYAGATEEFSVNAQEILPQGLVFDQDGLKLFVIGIDGDAVVEYDLSTNFDVSTAIYAGAAEEFFVGAQESVPTGLAFNHDGSRMYVVGQANDEVFQYNLSINFDVSTAAYSNESLDIQLQESSPTGLVFNEDGTEMYLIGSAGDDVVQYQLTSPFDVTTASHTGTSQEFSVTTEEGVPQDLFFDPVGRTLLILGNTGGGAIAQYHLMPNPVYSETSDNDGEVASSSPLVIQLSGDTFDDTGDDDLLDLPAQLTINNIPAGLTPVLSLSDNDTRVTVTFTGNATNHQSGDDVADITFSFDDTAFSSATAASVANSGSSSAQSSNSAIDFFNGAPAGIETDLALWLRSDFGTGSTTDGASLITWVGQSDAAVQASQGVPANQPVFHDNAIDNLNFNPVVSFDGTNGFLELPDNIVAAGDDALGFYAVWNSNADNATQRILSLGSTTSGSGLALQLGNSGNAGLQLEVAPNNQGLLVPYSINTTSLLTANTQALSGNDIMVALAGAAFSTGSVGNTNRSLTNSDNYLGQAPTGTERFNGQIAEIIVYNEPQSASERQRVESYLALKYGITLSNDNDGDGTPFEAAGINEGDYVASDELTVFWDAGANASYHNNVAGIVRDDGSDLEQKQSRSSNADALVTMGLDDDTNGPEQTNSANSGSFQADLSALVWGHDGEALYDNDENIDFDPVQVASRLNREWRVQETGTVGTVVVQFDVSNLEGPQGPGTSDESQIVLLVDNDSDFSAGASLVLQASVTNNDGLVNFRVDFNDGQYFTLASSEENALPITLISFDVQAHNDHVLLKWSTASEVNNSLFRIERSEDGSHFRSIGFKEGAGNSQSLEEYSFPDRQPQPGNNYYRLVDIDNQGNEHVSEIRRIYFETEEALLSLYPNPIQQNNLLKFKSSDSSLHDIRIIVDSSHGQRILDRVEAGKSYQELSIDTHTWTPGIYMLRVYEDGHLYKGPVKIVKQH